MQIEVKNGLIPFLLAIGHIYCRTLRAFRAVLFFFFFFVSLRRTNVIAPGRFLAWRLFLRFSHTSAFDVHTRPNFFHSVNIEPCHKALVLIYYIECNVDGCTTTVDDFLQTLFLFPVRVKRRKQTTLLST